VKSSKVGIIDCVSAGFLAVYRKPALLIVPVLLDLLLWFMPTISPQPIVSSLIDSLSSTEIRIETATIDQETQPSTPLAPTESFTTKDLEALGTANLAGILGMHVQSYLAFPSPGRSGQTTIGVTSWQGTVLSLLFFILGSVVIGTIYLDMLAQQVKTGAPWPVREGLLFRLVLRLLGYLAVVAAIYGTIAATCMILIAVAYPLLPVIVLLGLTIAFISLVYLFVGEAALFMEDVEPIQAVKKSFVFAREHMVSLIGLVLLTTVVSLGLQLALSRIATHPLGLPAAILLNACVMTALTFAVMNYYWYHTKGEVSGPQP
jgi:hypothetical protein